MKERPAVGGRKPLNNHLERVEEEREDFSCRRVNRTEDQQRAPGRQNSKHGTTSGRATNNLIEQQARPIATAGRRTGHGSNKEAQTQDEAFEAAGGHSRTPAPDAEATAATLHYDRSK